MDDRDLYHPVKTRGQPRRLQVDSGKASHMCRKADTAEPFQLDPSPGYGMAASGRTPQEAAP